jgi:hypothetical protein
MQSPKAIAEFAEIVVEHRRPVTLATIRQKEIVEAVRISR